MLETCTCVLMGDSAAVTNICEQSILHYCSASHRMLGFVIHLSQIWIKEKTAHIWFMKANQSLGSGPESWPFYSQALLCDLCCKCPEADYTSTVYFSET